MKQNEKTKKKGGTLTEGKTTFMSNSHEWQYRVREVGVSHSYKQAFAQNPIIPSHYLPTHSCKQVFRKKNLAIKQNYQLPLDTVNKVWNFPELLPLYRLDRRIKMYSNA